MYVSTKQFEVMQKRVEKLEEDLLKEVRRREAYIMIADANDNKKWREEVNEVLKNLHKAQRDKLNKISVDYNVEVKKTNDANRAHHKLIEGWLSEIKDFMMKAKNNES